jgi:predicted Zn-dependent peptidase
VEFKRVLKWAERYCNETPLLPASALMPRVTPAVAPPIRQHRERDTHQSHTLLGARAYDAKNPRRTALYLLTNMLGGPGMNSRLNVALRERSGLVYNVEANLTSYTDTGAFTIYYGCDPEDADRCRELAQKELRRLCEAPVSEAQLRAAKRQLKGQIGVTQDNYENLALDMAKIFLHYQRCEEKEEIFRRIEGITAKELQEVANEVTGVDGLSELSY